MTSSSKLAPRHKPPERETAQGANLTHWAVIYGAFIAGVLLVAGLAYLYYLQEIEDHGV